MEHRKPAGSPQRDSTDESLQKEREKSDHEVERRNVHAESTADAVVEQARSDADSVLRATREATQPQPNAVQALARGAEDADIQRQRDEADAKLGEERQRRTRALASLFALDRELTDQHLRAERTRADIALNNRDDFLGMVAHDLRGFMGEIALRADVIIRSAGEDEAGNSWRRMGQSIKRSTAGMSRLVGDLIDIAAIEAGRLHVEPAVGDLASVLRVAAEPFRAAAEAKRIVLDLEETPASVPAVFDHDRVIQVLGNLVSNAIKFTPSSGKISLRLGLTPAEAQLTVADSGEGIPAGKLEKVFERFAQVRSDHRGLGLGLYISRCLVEAMGGRIWAMSSPGSGTSICFTLPLAPPS